MKEHYVELHCDSDSWSNFVSRLEIPLKLDGKWVVAVDDISFPHDWNVDIEYRHNIHYHFPRFEEYDKTKLDLEKLMNNIKNDNEVAMEKLNIFLYGFDQIIKNFRLNDDMKAMIGFFKTKLAELNVPDETPLSKHVKAIINHEEDHKSYIKTVTDYTNSFQPEKDKPLVYTPYFNNILLRNITFVIKQISVYVDIIPYPNIIKTCLIKGIYSTQFSESYSKPQYYPVNKTYIDQIKVELKDTTKSHIKFNTGPIFLKLHFKQTK